MALSLMILAEGLGAELLAHLGPAAPELYTRMFDDTLDVAMQLSGAHVTVCYHVDRPPTTLAALPATTALLPLRTRGAAAVAEALAAGLASGGPTIVLSGNLPHLPLWRLRDAATHLSAEADLVLGPTDRGGWYLLGLRPATAQLVQVAPAPVGPLDALLAASAGHVTHILPLWFGISTVADLAFLAETLRTMPPTSAPVTRAMLEASQASRAVGG